MLIVAGTALSAGAAELDLKTRTERFLEILRADPSPGIVLDRLWDLNSTEPESLFTALGNSREHADRMILGLLQIKAGKGQEAVDTFSGVISEQPRSAAAWAGLARAWLLVPDARRAATAFERAYELAAADSEKQKLVLEAGKAWMDASAPEKAAQIWEQALESGAGNEDLRRSLVEIFISRDELEKALPHLEALAVSGSTADDAFRLSTLLIEIGDTDKAEEVLRSVLERLAPGHWQYAEAVARLAGLVERQGKVQEFVHEWEADSSEANSYRLALLYRALGDQWKEAEWLEKSLADPPVRAVVIRQRLVELFTGLGEWDRAEEYMKSLEGVADSSTHTLALARIALRRDDKNAVLGMLQPLAKKADDDVLKRILAFFLEAHMWEEAEGLLRQAVTQNREGSMQRLADFLLDRGNVSGAREVYREEMDQSIDPKARAALHGRLSEKMSEAGRDDWALEEIDAALGIDPGNTDLLVRRAEIAAALNKPDQAVASLRAAFELQPTDEALDRRLFAALAALPTDGEGITQLSSELATIRKNAGTSAQNSLRAARWAAWMAEDGLRGENVDAAIRHAQTALKLDPEFGAAREFLIELSIANNEPEIALGELEELLRRESSDREMIVRRIARVLMAMERVDEALERLRSLGSDNVDVLRDLALAQQAATLWYEALGTWRQAYTLAPQTRKREFLEPVVRIYQRLGLQKEAMDALEKAIAGEQDARARSALLEDLLKVAESNKSLEDVRDALVRRRRMNETDPFYPQALAQVSQRMGRPGEGLKLLASAAVSSQPEVLEKAVEQALFLGDPELALKLQRRVVARKGGVAAHLRLAGMLEQRGEDADAVWERLLRIFPQDVQALGAAAEYYGRMSRVRDVVNQRRRVVEANPGDAAAQAELARAALLVADEQSAAEAFDRVLELTEPVSGAVFLPRVTWREQALTLEPVAMLRLEAVTGLARIRGADWAERLGDEVSSEALHAWVAVGSGGRVLEMVLKAGENVRDGMMQDLVAQLLEMRAFKELADWLLDESERGADFFAVFPEYLNARNSAWSESEMAALFPERIGDHQFLWLAAVAFVKHYRLEEAVRLGMRVLEDTDSTQAKYGFEIARWLVVLGRMDEARTLLDRLNSEPEPGFFNAGFFALRDRIMLEPNGTRGKFIASRMDKLQEIPHLATRAAVAAFYYGVLGDREEAVSHIRQLVGMRALAPLELRWMEEPGAARFRRLLLTSGMQLEEWGMDWLALELWDAALEDAALAALHGPVASGYVNEMRVRRVALNLAMQRPDDALQIVDRGLNLPDSLASAVAIKLQQQGSARVAERIFEHLQRGDPRNPGFANMRIQLAGNLNEAYRVREFLQPLLEQPAEALEPAALISILRPAVGVLARAGRWDDASHVAGNIMVRNHEDPVSIALYVETAQNAGKPDLLSAKELASHSQATVEHKLLAAKTMLTGGNPEEGTEILEGLLAVSIEAGALLANWHMDKNRVQEAWNVVLRSGADDVELMEKLAGFGDAQRVVALLRQARERRTGAAEKLKYQRAMLRVIVENGLPGFSLEHRRHKRMTEHDEVEQFRYYEIASGTAWDAREEVMANWADGRGDLAAGAWLVVSRIKDKDGLKSICEKLLERGLNERLWAELAGRLEEAGEFEPAALFVGQLCEFIPSHEHYLLQFARLMWRTGQKKEYEKTLDRLANRRFFAQHVPTTLADFCDKLGDTAGARRYYEMAVRMAPKPSRAAVHFACASFLIDQNEAAAARVQLRAGCRLQGKHSADIVIKFIKATNESPDRVLMDIDAPLILREKVLSALVAGGQISPHDITWSADGLELLGEWFKQAEFEEALRVVESSTARHPQKFKALIHAFAAEREGTRAVELRQRAYGLHPIFLNASALAETLVSGGRDEEARALLVDFMRSSADVWERELAARMLGPE